MALFARDGAQEISAWEAREGISYACLTCARPVKLRTIRARVPHFYHQETSPTCERKGKGALHLFIQSFLQTHFTQGKGVLEKPFPSIQRIADLVFEEKRIIFEVQCSPISLEEAITRTEDYQSLGYTVIWVLSDLLFNRRKWKEAEEWIRKGFFFYAHPHKDSLFFYAKSKVESLDQILEQKPSSDHPTNPSQRTIFSWYLRILTNILKRCH